MKIEKHINKILRPPFILAYRYIYHLLLTDDLPKDVHLLLMSLRAAQICKITTFEIEKLGSEFLCPVYTNIILGQKCLIFDFFHLNCI